MTKLSVDQALLKAKSHVKKGNSEEAHKLYQAVLQAFPKNKRAQKGLAALNKPKHINATQGPSQDKVNQLLNLYNQGQFVAVVEQAQALIEQYPEAFAVWNILGATNKGLGRVQAASEAFKTVTRLNPNYADGFNNLGATLQDQGKFEEAIASYKKALSLKPDYAEAYNNMGNALKDQGKLGEAIASYKKALSLKPDYAEAYNNMGNALQDQGKFQQAITSYEKALSLKPDYAEAYNNMGNALKDQGKFQQAIASYKKALSLKPGYAEAHNNIGLVLQEQGKFDDATASYEKALSSNPNYAEAHRHLSTLIQYEAQNTQVALVGEMLQRPDLPDDDRCHLHYAYAKMHEDLGNFNVAYDNYVAGGKIRQKLLSYNFTQDKLIFDQIKSTASQLKEFAFNKPIIARRHTPIFILGMLRSGTTLVEQIVSSHSDVHGAGELPFLSRFCNSLSLGTQMINSENILQIRNAYLNELKNVSNGCPFVTDKMPQNFLYIGVLLKALPEAKVIHVKRDPAATCWSNFKHYFSLKGLGYSYHLKDTVNYFKLYQDLMEFWDQRYSGQIYHLDYDKLTVEQEPETKKLIEHLELDWEDTFLSPQENKRSVRTASQQQVREKVYTGSSQAWRKFELYLKGAFDEIKGE